MSKEPRTVLAATPISRAIVAALTIWPFENAAAWRNF
jgi:hypothetical protein